MADRDFERILSRQEILQIVGQDLGTNDFKLLDYKLSLFSENPMGFLGVHIKVSVTVQVSFLHS